MIISARSQHQLSILRTRFAPIQVLSNRGGYEVPKLQQTLQNTGDYLQCCNPSVLGGLRLPAP
uniref:Uncharacterized protein n=1 Tax=Desertifilum tharense IPPAS B-1220 TaxID=1781255 RepID=A0ACD5GP20_9CYAN